MASKYGLLVACRSCSQTLLHCDWFFEATAVSLYVVVMNVVSLYASVCRAALLLTTEESSTWGDLAALMPYLRRCLGCCACGGLLTNATVASKCGHSYCQRCGEGGAEPVLRITCRQCRKRDNLVPDQQMRTVVACYRALCALVQSYLYPPNVELAAQHSTRTCSVLGTLVAEAVRDIALPSLAVLPKLNFPPSHVQLDAERRRENVVRQVPEWESSASSLIAQLGAGLIGQEVMKPAAVLLSLQCESRSLTSKSDVHRRD